MEIILDGKAMTSKEAFHDEIEKKLAPPKYYGRNLDALYDFLAEIKSADIVLADADDMLFQLGDYARAALGVFREAAIENPAVRFTAKRD